MLVAGDHVLRYALQTNGRVREQRQTPEPAVVFTQVVSREDRSRTLHRRNSIRTPHRRVSSVQVSRLNFFIADSLLVSQPVLAGKQRGVRIREGAARRDKCQTDECLIDNVSFFHLRR